MIEYYKEMIAILCIGIAWANWDYYNFHKQHDNGYFSLKTFPGVIKIDFPHNMKWLGFFIASVILIHDIYMLVLMCILLFGAQTTFYMFRKKR